MQTAPRLGGARRRKRGAGAIALQRLRDLAPDVLAEFDDRPEVALP